MILLEEEPTLTDLHAFISKVSIFPVSAGYLASLAERWNMSHAVIDFYKSFPQDLIFEDKDDLLSRTEELDILHHQNAPAEEMRPTED